MILLLGSHGYVGRAFRQALEAAGDEFRTVARSEVDYTRFRPLLDLLRELRPEFVINAAGFTGKPNVDACETARAETLRGNVLLPQTLSQACEVIGVPWGHVSSGCIYDGAWVAEEAGERVEKDLTQPAIQQLIREAPRRLRGFREEEEPNFSFRSPPCSFYSGTKALAEEILRDDPRVFVWRLRIPFDEFDDPRNYLTKLQTYPKVYDNVNSVSHRGDFVRVCLELWRRRAPFGVYNVTNPGFVTGRQVVGWIQAFLQPGRTFEFWEGNQAFYTQGVKAPRSNCILDVGKLLATGIPLRSAEEAMEHALRHWRKST